MRGGRLWRRRGSSGMILGSWGCICIGFQSKSTRPSPCPLPAYRERVREKDESMGAEMKLEYSRREMLRMAGVAAGAAMLPAMAFGEDLKKRIPIGLELYSVRNELAKD